MRTIQLSSSSHSQGFKDEDLGNSQLAQKNITKHGQQVDEKRCTYGNTSISDPDSDGPPCTAPYTVGRRHRQERDEPPEDGRGRPLEDLVEPQGHTEGARCGADVGATQSTNRNVRVRIAVGVVDEGVEGLVDPLQEYHLGHRLVEGDHGPHDDHASRHLERHPARSGLQISRVWVERRGVELHGVLDLKCKRSRTGLVSEVHCYSHSQTQTFAEFELQTCIHNRIGK